MLGRVDARRGSRRDAELREDVLHVASDGSLTDHERGRDLAVALSAGDET